MPENEGAPTPTTTPVSQAPRIKRQVPKAPKLETPEAATQLTSPESGPTAQFVAPSAAVPVPNEQDIEAARHKIEEDSFVPPPAPYVAEQKNDEIRLETRAKPIKEHGTVMVSVTEDDSIVPEEDEVVSLYKNPEPIPMTEDEDASDEFYLAPLSGIVKTQTNKYLKLLRKVDINAADIVVEEFDGNDQQFKIAYQDSSRNLLATPRLARVPIVLSGYHAEIASFSHTDIISVARNLDDSDFVRRTELICNAIYQHITTTSRGDLTYEEWIEVTKWPDIEPFFFGIYTATYPGENPYDITCETCKHEFMVSVNNDDLAFISSKLIRPNDLQVIMAGSDAAIKQLPIWQKANQDPIPHTLKGSRIYVAFKMPSIKEFIATIRAIQVTSAQGTGFVTENIEEPKNIEYKFLRVYPYIDCVALPVVIDVEDETTGKIRKEIRYRGTRDRLAIAGMINQLSQEDFDSLLDLQEVIDLVNLRGLQFSIKAMECPNCHTHISSIPLRIRDIFFQHVETTVGMEA